jgi:RNA methyltransferase, TrmH family
MDEVTMITSKHNDMYKHLLKLKKAKYRNQHQEAIIFGQDLLDEAKRANKIIQYFSTAPHGSHLVITKELMDALVEYEMKDPIGAIISTKQDIISYHGNVLVCDTIQDPRNLGALIRSAHAFGFHKIMLSPECVDPYHELALRAAKGSTFHVNIEVKPTKETILALKKNKYQIIASTHLPQSSSSDFSLPCALILGNEGHGISNDLIELSDVLFHIQTQGVDSLNVSVAGSIMMYQLSEKL